MRLPVRTAVCLLCCVAAALLMAPVLRAWVAFSIDDESASHLILIPAISVAYVWMHRRVVFARVGTAWLPAVVVAVMALGLMIAGQAQPVRYTFDALTLSVAAFVGFCLSAFLLAYGTHAFRAALFPLLFLAWMIPIPVVALNTSVMFLKQSSADTVAALFSMTGTPYYRQGFFFTLPTVTIEVANECSGIRSSIALMLTGILVGQSRLTRAWTRTAFVIAIIPMAILKNGIRIVGLTLLASYVDPGFLTGRLHHDGGFVFFFMALALLFPILRLLQWAELVTAAKPSGGGAEPLRIEAGA